MATILEFKPRTATKPAQAPDAPSIHNPALPYSFDIYQSLPNGHVAIDACIPAAVAAAMLEMLRAIA
jgi:hypothetical protein